MLSTTPRRQTQGLKLAYLSEDLFLSSHLGCIGCVLLFQLTDQLCLPYSVHRRPKPDFHNFQNTPFLHHQILKPKVNLTSQLYPRLDFPCMSYSCKSTVLIIITQGRVILNHLFLPYDYQNRPCLNNWLSGIHKAWQRKIHLLLCNWRGSWKTFSDDISLHNNFFSE